MSRAIHLADRVVTLRIPLQGDAGAGPVPPHGLQGALRRQTTLGKIGSNINQIAHHLNAGRPGDVMEGSVDAAMNELLEWPMALMQALGYERNRKPPA